MFSPVSVLATGALVPLDSAIDADSNRTVAAQADAA